MKVTTISSCEVISATCSGGRVEPDELVTVVILRKPHAENPTTIKVRMISARMSRLRDVS